MKTPRLKVFSQKLDMRKTPRRTLLQRHPRKTLPIRRIVKEEIPRQRKHQSGKNYRQLWEMSGATKRIHLHNWATRLHILPQDSRHLQYPIQEMRMPQKGHHRRRRIILKSTHLREPQETIEKDYSEGEEYLKESANLRR